MHSFMKKGVLIAAVIGMTGIFQVNVSAAETNSSGTFSINMEHIMEAAKEINNNKETTQVIVKEEETESVVMAPEQKGKYLNMAFANRSSGCIIVRSAPSEESDWVGKLYSGSAMTVLGPVGEWTAIQSGNVKGFVQTSSILVGKEAQKEVRRLEAEALEQKTEIAFRYGETKEEEQARLQREEEERKRQEEEAKRKSGQAVVDYAEQFIGNPYVWGGTSLTNGADCSGFVQSVYAHFGFSLPRTSAAQRSVGSAVSYDEAQPGDIICYEGHVGIYAGNGQIVNAQDPAHGIGLSPATYTSIVTVRRMF